MILSIDPGVRGCGCALFERRELHVAAYVCNPLRHGQGASEAAALGWAVADWAVGNGGLREGHIELVIECPRVYAATFQKGDQNTSIIPLSLIVGAMSMSLRYGAITQYFPRDWKGTADADLVTIPLIKERLSEIERGRVQLPADSLAHNVWDGVGVGLKFLGRFEPKRVFHREPR